MIWATEDPHFGPQWGARLLRHIPGATRLERLPDTGHLLMEERPDTIAALIAELYASWFRCLADPTRLEILNVLASEHRPLSVGEIVERVGVGQSTVSTHLRRLAETCFVLVEHRGRSSLFQINEGCIACFPSAAELVMGRVEAERMPAPRPGATSRRRRRLGDQHRAGVPRAIDEGAR